MCLAYMYASAPATCRNHKGQKSELDPLELELKF